MDLMQASAEDEGVGALQCAVEALDREQPGWRPPCSPLDRDQIVQLLIGDVDQVEGKLIEERPRLPQAAAQLCMDRARQYPGGEKLPSLDFQEVWGTIEDRCTNLAQAMAATPAQLFQHELGYHFDWLDLEMAPTDRVGIVHAARGIAAAAGIAYGANRGRLQRLVTAALAGWDHSRDHLRLCVMWFGEAAPMLQASVDSHRGRGWHEVAWRDPHLQLWAPGSGHAYDVAIAATIARRLEPKLCRVVGGYTSLGVTQGVRIARLGYENAPVICQAALRAYGRDVYTTSTSLRGLRQLEAHGL